MVGTHEENAGAGDSAGTPEGVQRRVLDFRGGTPGFPSPNSVRTAAVEDYIFGFGSIINSESRASSGAKGCAATAELLPSFGWTRSWNFRKDTGFTALGLQRASPDGVRAGVCGVVFAVEEHMSVFDEREVGYRRVRVPASELALRTWGTPADPSCLASPEQVAMLQRSLDNGDAVVWTYIPEQECTFEADNDHPICQTYVDAVLGGCLDCGGEEMAVEMVTSTVGWSEHFLNDVPMSRRPWLHRRSDYGTIDRLLEEHSEITLVDHRRHPEEFGRQVAMATRGMLNVPRRNKMFVGRERELERLHTHLHAEDAELTCGVAALGTVGLGGVGKTQIAIEYCYRQYQRNIYGLVCWLNAESLESLAADFRRLASEFQVEVGDKKNEEVVEEIKACFYRARCSWLLVFDNADSPGIVRTHLPRGGKGKFGHVLITSRRLTDEWRDRSIILDCFNAEESAAFLCKAVTPAKSKPSLAVAANDAVVNELAERLGYLPLALAMAAAYMQRCDVTFESYIKRYDQRRQILGKGTLDGEYPLTVAGSLSLSLDRMEKESSSARCVLDSLCFMAPDGVTKALVQLLLQSILADVEPAGETEMSPAQATIIVPTPAPEAKRARPLSLWIPGTLSSCGTGIIAIGMARILRRSVHQMWKTILVTTGCVGLGVVGILAALNRRRASIVNKQPNLPTKPSCSSSSATNVGEMRSMPPNSPNAQIDLNTSAGRLEHLEDETDRLWGLMKSYSIFVVREGTASMHRLLQQVLRGRQSSKSCRVSLGRCIWVLQELWCFEPADNTTWQEAGSLIEHIKSVGRFCAEYKTCRCECSALLTEAAMYTSMALSGFDEAQRLLELALQMQEELHGTGPDETTARIMYELGKVFRYRGNLDLAEETLQQALKMQQLVWTSHERLEIAVTLHEIGVIYFKKQDLAKAEAFLQRSLDLKRRLPRDSNSTRETQRREEAVTLHHLAQVATASKPPRLDEAETLLQTALRLEGKATFSRAGARGSTLQQLGRVSIRRGKLDQARRYLLQALQLHESAYGSQQHVNVATDHHQLGLVEMNRRRYGEASEHLLSALRIRRSIYVRGEHVDVAVRPNTALPLLFDTVLGITFVLRIAWCTG
jgi:tetratricopeptide (TPR) repeat protein